MTALAIWEPHTLRHGEALRFELGPLSLLITRRPEEWRLRSYTAREPFREHLYFGPAASDELVHEQQSELRIAAHDDREERHFQLVPLLADRFVLARPETPITVLAGSQVAVYLTTPIWLQLRRVPGKELMAELPTFRPSDSWLGPPTGEGPLCYASWTFARLQLEELHASPMRATTRILLRNNGPTLQVQRLIVPAPQLRLYRDDTGRFWTDEVELTRGRDGLFSAVHFSGRPPRQAGEVRQVGPAREPAGTQNVLRAVTNLLGG